MKGLIYVAQPKGNGQPDLWVALGAGGIHLNVRARTAIEDGRFVTKLAGLPDMPLSDLSMSFGGSGEDSLLSLGASPCVDGRPRRFLSDFTARGQDGAKRSMRLPIGMKHPRCGAAGGR